MGGINTVLRTKAAVSIDEMGDQYCMIGPYVEKGVQMEVELEDPVKLEPIASVINKMKEYGFKVRSLSFNSLTIDISTTLQYIVWRLRGNIIRTALCWIV